jgi:serine/threonine-protein kinase RsbW
LNELPIIDESPASSETIRLDLPASLKYLNILGACLTAMLAHAHDIQHKEIISYNIQLALHEICTNITIHAYAHLPRHEAGRIEIAITLHPEEKSLEFELSDEGKPFDEHKVAEPDLVHGQIHGYGLYLARNLMDSVEYQRRGQKNVWHLTKNL